MGHLANKDDKHDNTMQNYDSFFTRDGGSTAKYLAKLTLSLFFLVISLHILKGIGRQCRSEFNFDDCKIMLRGGSRVLCMQNKSFRGFSWLSRMRGTIYQLLASNGTTNHLRTKNSQFHSNHAFASTLFLFLLSLFSLSFY